MRNKKNKSFDAASPRELLSGFLIICQIIFQFYSEQLFAQIKRESKRSW